VKLTADTNVLIRAVVADDAKQARIAQSALEEADLVAIPSTTLCEMAWVLARGYGISALEVGNAIRTLVGSAKVEADRPVIEAGLAMLGRGGDFADGVIAAEGTKLGGDIFASFDKSAVTLLRQQGGSTLLPS